MENEYQRFLRLVEYDLNFLLKKFFLHFEQDLLSSNNDTLNSLHKKYGNDGNLTINEFIAMTKSLLNEKYKFGKLAAINELLTGTIPDGWQAALCFNCGKPVIGCMENVTKALRIIISGKSRPLTHTYVGMSCG